MTLAKERIHKSPGQKKLRFFTRQTVPVWILKCSIIEVKGSRFRIRSHKKFPVSSQRLDKRQALDPESSTVKSTFDGIIIPYSSLRSKKIHLAPLIPILKWSYTSQKKSSCLRNTMTNQKQLKHLLQWASHNKTIKKALFET